MLPAPPVGPTTFTAVIPRLAARCENRPPVAFRPPRSRSLLGSRTHRLRIVAGVVAGLVLVLTGCEVRTVIEVKVQPTGAGTVTARIGLDKEAQSRIGDLWAIRYEDLAGGGWSVAPIPEPDKDGWVWLQAEKPFDDETDLESVLAELSGEDGVFQDFTLDISDGFATTTYSLQGEIDGTGGYEQFSDPQVAAVLDGLVLGRTPEELAAEVGDGSSKASIELQVNMPGDSSVRNSSGDLEGGPLVWRTEIGAATPVSVDGTSEVADSTPILLLRIGAGLILLAAVSLLIAWRRTRRLRRLRRLRR